MTLAHTMNCHDIHSISLSDIYNFYLTTMSSAKKDGDPKDQLIARLKGELYEYHSYVLSLP